MAATLPYLSSPGTVDTIFKRIKEAAKPERVTADFVTTVLQIKGGTGDTVAPFLKKLGFVNSDGSPTGLYDRLRNDTTSGLAVAEAMKAAYRPLYQVNEHTHKLSDAELQGLILQVTGLEKDNRVAELILGTFKRLKSHARFDGVRPTVSETAVAAMPARLEIAPNAKANLAGLGLSYTINLNLPPSTNIEVFNAIFKSLREHLLKE